jgi:hypothetical protein
MVLIAIGVVVGVVASLMLVSSDGLEGLVLLLFVVASGFLSLVVTRLVFESAVALVLVAQNTSKSKSTK